MMIDEFPFTFPLGEDTMIDTKRAKIRDFSRHQGEISQDTWHRLEDDGVVGAALRCVVGNYYTDTRFLENWERGRNTNIKLTPYAVIAPEYSAESQFDRFERVMEDRKPDWPAILDCELDRGQENWVIVNRTYKYLRLLEEWDYTKRLPEIYSGKWFWDRHMIDHAGRPPPWTSYYGLFHAQYPVATNPPQDLPEAWRPTLPLGWNNWDIWQWTDKGKEDGIQSSVDFGVFNGTKAEFLAWVGNGGTPPTPPTPPVPPTGETKLRVTNSVLNIRTGPGTNYKDIGDLHKGDIVGIINLGGDDCWVEFEPGKWAAFKYKGYQYMEIVP